MILNLPPVRMIPGILIKLPLVDGAVHPAMTFDMLDSPHDLMHGIWDIGKPVILGIWEHSSFNTSMYDNWKTEMISKLSFACLKTFMQCDFIGMAILQ